MKNLKLLIILFVTNCAFSQYGIVKYAIRTDRGSRANEARIEIRDMVKSINTHVDLQKFELNFSKDLSIFKNTTLDLKKDSNISQDYKIAEMLTSRGILYYNKKSKELISDINNGTLLIEKVNIAQWHITKESKKIDKYTCLKAIKNTPFKNRKGESKIRTVIAWFSPELPYSFGPKNYVGLPGLVLEVEESNKLIYYATSIKILKKPITIKIPKGKTISKEDYEAKLKAQMGM